MSCRKEYFVNSYFPCTVNEWNNLSPEICKLVSYEVFKNLLLKLEDLLPIACLMSLIFFESNFLLDYVTSRKTGILPQ